MIVGSETVNTKYIVVYRTADRPAFDALRERAPNFQGFNLEEGKPLPEGDIILLGGVAVSDVHKKLNAKLLAEGKPHFEIIPHTSLMKIVYPRFWRWCPSRTDTNELLGGSDGLVSGARWNDKHRVMVAGISREGTLLAASNNLLVIEEEAPPPEEEKIAEGVWEAWKTKEGKLKVILMEK